MPIYEYQCDKCEEIIEDLREMANRNKVKRHDCPGKGKLRRTITVPILGLMDGGTTTTEAKLLKKKQKQRSYRSKQQFKNEELRKVEHPAEKRAFEQRLKHVKGDHEKS